MQRFSGVKVYDRRGDKWSDVTLCAFATSEQEEDNEDDDIVTTTPAAAGRSGCVLELMDEHGVFMMKYLMGTLRAAQAEHRSLHADPAKKTTTTTTTTASSSASLPSYAEDGSRQPHQRCPAEEGVVMHRGGGSSGVTSATVTRQTTPILSSSAGAASLIEGNNTSNAAVRGVSAPSSLASSLLPHPGRLSRPSSSSSSSSDDEEDEGTMYCAERHDSVAGPAQRVPPRQRRSASHDMRANCFRLVLRTVTPRAARVPLSATLRLRLGLMPSAAQRPAYSSHSAPRILYPLSRAPLRGQQCQTLRQTAEASTLVEGCAAVAMRAAEEGEGQTRVGQQSESLAQQQRGGRRCDAIQRAMPQAVSLCDAMHRPWQRGYPSRTQAPAAAAACNKESVEDSGQGQGVVIQEERRVSYAPFALPRSMPEPWCTAGRAADSQGPVTHSLKGRSATMRCGTPQTTTTTTTMMGHDGGKGGSAWSGVPTRGAYNFLAPLTSVEELYDVMLYGALSEPVSTVHQLQARQTSSRSSSESERRKGPTRTTRQASIDETTPSKATVTRKKGAAAMQKGSFSAASRATLASSRHLLQDLLHLFHLPRRPPRPKTANNNSNTTTQMATSANTSITNTTLSSTLPSPSSLHQCERRSSSASTTQTCPSQPAVEVYLTLRFDGEATLRRFLRECVQRMMPPPDIDPYVQADSHDDEESSLTSGSAEPYAMPEPPAGIVYCDKDAEGSEMDEQQSHTAACVTRKPRMLRSTRSLQRELTRSQTLQSSYHRSTMNDDNTNTSTRQSWTEYFCYDTMPLRQPSSHAITAAHPHRHRHHSLPSPTASLQCADIPVYLWYAWRREAAKAYASCERGLLVIEAAVHGAHALLLLQQQEQPSSDVVLESCEAARVGHMSMQPRNNAMARGGNSGEACVSSEHRECTLQQLCAVVGRGGDKAVSDDTRGGENDDGVQEEDERERRDRQATALSCPLTLPDSLHREGYATPQEGGEERSEETVRVVLQEAPHTRSARQRRLLVQQQYVAPLLGSDDTMGNRDSYNVITHNNNMSACNNDEEEAVGCGPQTAGPLLHPLLHRGAHFDDAFLCLTDTHLLFMNSFAEVVLHLTLDEVTLLVHSPTASHGSHRTRRTHAMTSATAMREGGNSNNNKKANRVSNNTSKTARTDEGCNERQQQQQCDDECLPFVSLLTRPGSNESDEPALLITFVLLPTIPPTPPSPATTIKGGGRMHDSAVLSSAQTIVMKENHKSVVSDNGNVMGRSPPLASREYVAPQPRKAYKANDTPTLTAQQGSSTAATTQRTILEQQQADYGDAADALNERLETLLSRLTSRLSDVPCVTCTQAALRLPSSSMGSAAKAMSPSLKAASVGRTRRVDTARPASTPSSDMSRALPVFLPPCLRQPRRCTSYNVSDVELLWRLNAQPLPRYPILRADLYRAAHAIPALLSADSCSSSSSSSSSLSLLPPAADTGQVAYEGQPHLNTRRRATQDARNTVATTTRPPTEDEYAIISPRRQRTVLIRRALFW